MAFPTVQSVTGTAFSSAATSFAVAMPATVNSGDLLVMLFGAGAGGSTPPTGWTLIDAWNANVIFARAADGTEGGTTATVTIGASSKAAALVYRITGWINSGTITNDVKKADGASDGANPDPPSLTPGWTDDTLWLAMAWSNASTTLTSVPTNYTSGQVQASGGTGGATTKYTVFGAQRQLNAATEDPGTFTIGSSNTSIGMTVAIRPAASGVTNNQTLTATAVTSTATMQRQTNKAVTATATTSTATFQKQVNKPLTSTAAGSTATVQKQVNKAMTATAVTSTATLAALKVIVRTLTATAVTSTATMTRQVNKLLTATAATSTATMVRSVAKMLTATAITSTASVQKQVNKAMTAAAIVATASLAAPRLLSVTLTAAAVTSTATLAAVFQAAAGTVTALFMGIFGHSNPPQGSENEDL